MLLSSIAPLAFAALLQVQQGSAAVTGVVRDAKTGRPLAGAWVGWTPGGRAAVADSAGRYVFRDVGVGPQHLIARLLGYRSVAVRALVPPAGTLQIDLSLEQRPYPLQNIEVRAPVDVGGRADSDGPVAGRVLSALAVRNSPLVAEPDLFQALGGGEVVLEPETPSGVHIRGGSSDQTSFLLDGIPVLNPYHAGGVFGAWNPDAVAQVRLAASAIDGVEVLGGAVSATTVAPRGQAIARGGVSTAQTRATVAAPIGRSGAGFLVSGRSGYPNFFAPRRESTYFEAASSDWLASLTLPIQGGRLQLLGYRTDNELATAVSLSSTAGHLFDWQSTSFGAQWSRQTGRTETRLVAWRAASEASSAWAVSAASIAMDSRRTDAGLAVTAVTTSARGRTGYGVRLHRIATDYRTSSESAIETLSLANQLPLLTGFLEHDLALSSRVSFSAGASLTAASSRLYWSPRVELRWHPVSHLRVSGSYLRGHQFVQSLRNPESVVGSVFPADLFVGAGAGGVPVATSDEGSIAVEYRPRVGVKLGLLGYRRVSQGLVLVAPVEPLPFGVGRFATGGGTATGVAADIAINASGFGLVARYGFQAVQLQSSGGQRYSPQHGTRHLVDLGALFSPTASWSLRAGLAGAVGRQATRVAGGFEWESCNLSDRGCEFAGSPRLNGPLGGDHLPSYWRLDLGVRKNWQIRLGGRDVAVALFGTVTNVLGRSNLLTHSVSPETGEPSRIEMRPRAPLVLGLDWTF